LNSVVNNDCLTVLLTMTV